MTQSHYAIQLMRPALLSPFLLTMDERKLDTDRLLERHGLSRSRIRNDRGMITAQQVHPFLRSATEASGDPAFCWRVGWKVEHHNYIMFADQLALNLSLAELLTELAFSAENLASATRFELHIPGAYASFTSYRLYKSDSAPHADAFSVGALSSLLKRYVKQRWNPAEVSLELADLDSMALDSGSRLVQTQLPGRYTIRFPTAWLLRKGAGARLRIRTRQGAELDKAASLVGFLKSALRPYLDDPGLTAEEAANRIGNPLREINQSLQPRNTTLAQLIDQWRQALAREKLKNADLRVADVGSAVGYPDPTSFSRVFRRWTGMSPRAYRNSAR